MKSTQRIGDVRKLEKLQAGRAETQGALAQRTSERFKEARKLEKLQAGCAESDARGQSNT